MAEKTKARAPVKVSKGIIGKSSIRAIKGTPVERTRQQRRAIESYKAKKRV